MRRQKNALPITIPVLDPFPLHTSSIWRFAVVKHCFKARRTDGSNVRLVLATPAEKARALLPRK